MIVKRVLRWLLVATLCMGMTGCEPRSVDINHLALVMAVGIDKVSPSVVRVTAQIARSAAAIGQSGVSSGAAGEPVFTASAEGRSLNEAVNHLERFSSRRIYWAHCKIIVLNEPYARAGIGDVIDFFTRNHEMRMRTWVAATPDAASQLVSAKTGIETIPADSIEKVFRYARALSEAPLIDLRTLQADFLSDEMEVVLPELQIKSHGLPVSDANAFHPTPQVELAGAAYIGVDKRMKGWLSAKQSKALAWFRSAPNSRLVVVACPDDPHQHASLEMKNYRFQVVPYDQHGHIIFRIHLRAGFNLVELSCASHLSPNQLNRALSAEAAALLRQEITDIVHFSQQRRLDFLGAGQVFREKYPLEWSRLRRQWLTAYANADFKVIVTAGVHSGQLLQQPMNPGKTNTEVI